MATATPGVNPYAKPNAAVTTAAEEYQDVKLFSVSGRVGRLRYIAYSVGVTFLLAIIAGVLAAVVHPFLAVIAYIGIFVIGIMLTIQRCHDFNTTGWLSLLVLVPLVPIIFWFIPGTDGENNYGAKTPPNGVGVIIGACIIPIVAIIGIVAAVALPAYQDYTKRAKAMQQQQQQQQQAPKR